MLTSSNLLNLFKSKKIVYTISLMKTKLIHKIYEKSENFLLKVETESLKTIFSEYIEGVSQPIQ